MTEIEKVKSEIKVLEKKLSFLEELEKIKTPCEEAYKKVYGVYPTNEITYNSMWGVFQKGYYAAQEDYKIGKFQEPEKSKINDLAEKLLPDDHPYKIADEHGETNPYKQGLNMIEDEKKMKELGFVKNAEGYWTARPLAQEDVKKLQEKEWDIKVVTDYLTGKSRHKLNIVDKDGNDYKPEPLTTEELLKPNWEPKPQNENEVAGGLREAFREAVKQGIIPEIDEVSDEFMDEMVAKLKGQTLYDVCMEWCNDDYHKDFINDLISRIEEWLPKPQNSDGSQNVYVECAVEGYNDAIKQIKSKLR